MCRCQHRSRLKVWYLQGEAHLPSHARSSLQLVDVGGIGLVEQLQGSPVQLQYQAVAVAVLPHLDRLQPEPGAIEPDEAGVVPARERDPELEHRGAVRLSHREDLLLRYLMLVGAEGGRRAVIDDYPASAPTS